MNKYGIKELRDGLTIEIIKGKYSWLLEAEIKNAIIGEINNRIIWYDGTWKKGTWEKGTWHNGVWESGTWEYGTWDAGYWKNGFKVCGQCQWIVSYNPTENKIKIGCETKTVNEWGEWFSSDEIYNTERGTPEFNSIYKSFLIAQSSIIIERTGL